MMAVFATVSFIAGPLYDRLGPKLLASIGTACLAAGLLLIALVAADESYSAIILGLSSPALVSASSTRRSPPPE